MSYVPGHVAKQVEFKAGEIPLKDAQEACDAILSAFEVQAEKNPGATFHLTLTYEKPK